MLICVGSCQSLGVDTQQVITSSQSGVNGPVAPASRNTASVAACDTEEKKKKKKKKKKSARRLSVCDETDEPVQIH